jgi:hypothetical protein
MAIPIKPDNKLNAMQPGQPKPMQQGSGFTNVQRVAQANQNNRLGQAVGSGVQQVGQQARTAIGAGQQQFQQDTQKNNLDTTENRTQVQNLVQDPTKASQADIDKFSQYRSGQYHGPQGIQNYDELSNQAQQAQQLGQSANTAGGRLALLQRFAARPQQSYTSGQSRLDAALLGQTGSQGLRQARQSTLGIQGQLDQGQQAAQAQAQELQARAAGLKSFTEGQIKGQTDPMHQQLQAAADAANAARDAQVVKAQQDFAAGKVSSDELNELGLGDLAGQETYGTDLSRFISGSGVKADELGVASKEQAAKLNALARLGGTEAFGDEAQAGSFAKNKYNVDKNAIQQQLAQSKADYDALTGQTQGQIDAAQQGMAKAIQGLGEGERNLLAKSFGYNGDPANWTAKNALIAQKLEERYGGLSPDQQKIMRESGEYGFEVDNPGYQPNYFGNSSISGAPKTYNFNPLQNSAVRDAFTSAYSQKQAQQAALQQLRDKYKIGSKFGG